MSTIREVALAAYGGRLPRGTGAKAQVVLDAVVAREQGIFADLVEAGVGMGASRDTVHDLLVEAGLTAPDPAPEAEADCSSVEAKVDALAATVDRALAWARRKGYIG